MGPYTASWMAFCYLDWNLACWTLCVTPRSCACRQMICARGQQILDDIPPIEIHFPSLGRGVFLRCWMEGRWIWGWSVLTDQWRCCRSMRAETWRDRTTITVNHTRCLLAVYGAGRLMGSSKSSIGFAMDDIMSCSHKSYYACWLWL